MTPTIRRLMERKTWKDLNPELYAKCHKEGYDDLDAHFNPLNGRYDGPTGFSSYNRYEPGTEEWQAYKNGHQTRLFKNMILHPSDGC